MIRSLNIVIGILLLFSAVSAYAQTDSLQYDSLAYQSSLSLNDSILTDKPDSTKKPKQIFESPITYNSSDSMAVSMEDGKQIVYLYGNAEIKYGTIDLTAGFISVNLATKEIYAEGIKDSSETIVQKPHFKEGSEEFDCSSLRYNFDTGKGFVENVISSQQDGKVQSAKAKMLSKDIFCMADGKYSTCDAEHPHFFLNITKGKIINNKAIIAGFSYMVLEDFPLYFPFLPYGYIPTNNTTYSSGVILPTQGELNNRGYYLKDGGFYWAASDYFDLKLTGEIYTKGSWGVNVLNNYRLRYKFSGSFSFGYRNLVLGERGINQTSQSSFSITWSHSQDQKSSPSIQFSANVNFSSSGYSKNHEYDNTQKYLQNSQSSSISFRKTFSNTPFSMSVNMRESQNTKDSTISLSLPEFAFNMKTIQPFKRKKRVGSKGIFEDISIGYTANIKNQISTKENKLLSSKFSDWKKGVDHTFNITLPSFRLLNYINFTPSISHKQRWYFDYLQKYWVDGYTVKDFNTGMNKWVSGHVEAEQKNGFKINYEYSGGIGASTTLYGFYQMKNTNSYFQALRHKVDLSVSFNYHPDFGREQYGFYDWVQVDSLGSMEKYNIFQNGIFGSTGEGKSGSVGFSLNNNLEMKVRNLNDTISKEKFKKVAIFDNLGLSGNYNLAADSMNLSTISLIARTKIAGTVISISGTLNPYALDSRGKITKKYMWNTASGISKLGRITNLSTGFGFNINSDQFQKKQKENAEGGDSEGIDKKQPSTPNSSYQKFSMPWRLSFNYSIYYTNTTGKPAINQSLGFNGGIDFSDKWKANFTSSFDFKTLKIGYTNVSVVRNLHCWTMSFNFSPVSQNPYYSFTLSANASMLKDLKIDKTNRNY